MITSLPLLDELGRVVQYEKLKPHFPDPLGVVVRIQSISVVVEPQTKVTFLNDESDNRLLEAAQEGHADYLVTGDRGVMSPYADGFEVVTPKEFLEILEGNEPT